MLNKPKGYVTTVADDKGRKTVMDLLKIEKVRLFPVGRLDYDTEGLLILTNDGDLAYALTHPKNQIGKTYVAKVEGEIPDDKIYALRKGIDAGENKFGKSYVKVINKTQNETKLEITIFEGQNRQIRKMLLSVGKEVKFLKRIKIGNLKLTGLNRGEFRHLTKAEVSYLKGL
ncbi:MAG: pseudouridine synthase [Firmicutes bacterium]|nr:pseudouridine synthase [Bacillota bacterium]